MPVLEPYRLELEPRELYRLEPEPITPYAVVPIDWYQAQWLTGHAQGIGTLWGRLIDANSFDIVGHAQGVGTATAQLRALAVLRGDALGTGTATGDLIDELAATLTGDALGLGTAAGDLIDDLAGKLAGDALGTGTATGDIIDAVAGQLVGAATGVGTATGQLFDALADSLVGAALGVGTAAGNRSPSGPINLTATLNGAGTFISLFWTNTETGDAVHVERRINGGPWAPRISLGGTASSFNDTDLGSPHGFYEYRVRLEGLGGRFSEWSNIAGETSLRLEGAATGVATAGGRLDSYNLIRGSAAGVGALTGNVVDDGGEPVKQTEVSETWSVPDSSTDPSGDNAWIEHKAVDYGDQDGNWGVTGGKSYPINNNFTSGGWARAVCRCGVALSSGDHWVRAAVDNGGAAFDNRGRGVSVRMANANSHQGYHVIGLNSSEVAVYAWPDDNVANEVQVAKVPCPEIVPSTTYTLEVEVEGEQIRVYVNDTLYIDVATGSHVPATNNNFGINNRLNAASGRTTDDLTAGVWA